MIGEITIGEVAGVLNLFCVICAMVWAVFQMKASQDRSTARITSEIGSLRERFDKLLVEMDHYDQRLRRIETLDDRVRSIEIRLATDGCEGSHFAPAPPSG